jgi:hypothetical protein
MQVSDEFHKLSFMNKADFSYMMSVHDLIMHNKSSAIFKSSKGKDIPVTGHGGP